MLLIQNIDIVDAHWRVIIDSKTFLFNLNV